MQSVWKNLAYHGGTSNLHDHLEWQHSHVYKLSAKETDGKQTTIIGIKKCTKKRAKAISNIILNFIIKDNQPIATVEGEGFRNLIHLLEPGYQETFH